MGFFARMSNVWSGFLSLFVKGLEVRNPEAVYEASIDSLTEKYSRLKEATSAIIRRRDQIKFRLEEEQKKLLETNVELTAALDQNDHSIAKLLIEKQELLEKAILELEGEASLAIKDADDAKDALVSVKSEIQKMKSEKDRNIAKLQSAEARNRINAQLEGLSVDAEVQALENVRAHIGNKVAEANLTSELKDSDLDNRLAKLRKTSGSLSAQAKLDKLLAERAAKSQIAPVQHLLPEEAKK